MHFFIISLIFLFKAGLLLTTCIRFVPQGYHWTVERFGRYCRTLKPGVNLIMPGVESVGRKVSMLEETVAIKRQKVISSDNAMVTADAVCRYRVTNAALAGHQVDNLAHSMRELIMSHVREVLSSLELLPLTTNRMLVDSLILAKIEVAAKSWGVVVERFEICALTHRPMQ